MAIHRSDRFMGKLIAGAMERVLDKHSSESEQPEPKVKVPSQGIDGFIYVPAIQLYVAKGRTLQGIDWNA